ncbi:unnamed protein product [Parascedosporium putredinis]|uniref:Glucanase n=1 Tax=Parascedosporium putredinis TaxID=1442378 RepID=A0A9P1GVE9_9PEZI|nr:unnamed protein product [Parascedosporium putredinis]CAI7988097.1 unnamed protein product [Parascedosporium putredinis]
MSLKNILVALAAMGATVVASPAKSKRAAAYDGNPFEGVAMYVNPYYRDEIHDLALPQMTGSLAEKAKQVAEIPSFQWLSARPTTPVPTPYAGLFVIYNFPDRDCSAKASDGELHLDDNGLERYQTEYIDPIAELVKEYDDIRTIFVYEPDGLANLVTNLEDSQPKCQGAAEAYHLSTVYAMETLNFDNVALYVDGGHAGWLGWPGNLNLTAEVFGNAFKEAGKPKSVRGVATNVSNYNAVLQRDRAPAYTDPNPNWDESRFHEALAPFLEEHEFPAHFIVDTGRSGVQPAGRESWGNWCNIKETGFGIRPSSNTPTELLDAFVWVKPGGESDGTSDEEAVRYDTMCSSNSSVIPAPEAGDWFQDYFEMLINNANPLQGLLQKQGQEVC